MEDNPASGDRIRSVQQACAVERAVTVVTSKETTTKGSVRKQSAGSAMIQQSFSVIWMVNAARAAIVSSGSPLPRLIINLTLPKREHHTTYLSQNRGFGR